MTEDQQDPSPSPEDQADQPEAAAEEDAQHPDSGNGEESPSEGVTELAKPVETKKGDCSEEELGPLRPICANADQKYHQVLSYLKEFKEAERVLQRFQARVGKLTPLDVNKAKKDFHRAKKLYIEAGNEINEGIKQVHSLAETFPEDLIVQNLYKTYLAKLLASLQTRNQVEPFVELLAAGGFDFERNEIVPDEREEQRGLTAEKKITELLESTARMVNMLESRYLKRQLQNRLRLGENPVNIRKRLVDLLARDQEDLHTYIWLAKMLNDEYDKDRNQNTRVAMRDEILTICKKAFALIDDFLTLQGIHDQNDRDRSRSSYVRSITAIRNPLMGTEG